MPHKSINNLPNARKAKLESDPIPGNHTAPIYSHLTNSEYTALEKKVPTVQELTAFAALHQQELPEGAKLFDLYNFCATIKDQNYSKVVTYVMKTRQAIVDQEHVQKDFSDVLYKDSAEYDRMTRTLRDDIITNSKRNVSLTMRLMQYGLNHYNLFMQNQKFDYSQL